MGGFQLERRGFLAGLAAVLAGSTARASEIAPVVMRFAMRGLQPVTTMFVGGKGPFLMLIDTGDAVGFSLRRDVIDKLNLRQTAYGRTYGATGTEEIPAYLAHDVLIGNAVREPDLVLLGPDRPFGGLDGIIPFALLSSRPTDMDFTTGELRVHMSGGVDRTGFRPLGCETGSAKDGGSLVATVSVYGAPARLAVDTGAAVTVSLYPDYVRRHDLWARHARYIDYSFGGATRGVGRARLVRTPELQLGPYRFEDPVISLSDPRMTVVEEVDGLLGIEMLNRFTLGFDAGASTLWLKPNDHLADPYPYDHSGLTWEWKDGAAMVVRAAGGSPSEAAGLKPGDRLVGFADAKAAMMWDRSLRGPADTPVSVEVMREGKPTPVTMMLKDWL